jgi:uridine kinase
VLNISSDDYYTDQTGLKFLLYGTFDHPNLIQYDLLQKNLDEYFTKGHTTLPKYSFVERRRVSLDSIAEDYDYVLVE